MEYISYMYTAPKWNKLCTHFTFISTSEVVQVSVRLADIATKLFSMNIIQLITIMIGYYVSFFTQCPCPGLLGYNLEELSVKNRSVTIFFLFLKKPLFLIVF